MMCFICFTGYPVQVVVVTVSLYSAHFHPATVCWR